MNKRMVIVGRKIENCKTEISIGELPIEIQPLVRQWATEGVVVTMDDRHLYGGDRMVELRPARRDKTARERYELARTAERALYLRWGEECRQNAVSRETVEKHTAAAAAVERAAVALWPCRVLTGRTMNSDVLVRYIGERDTVSFADGWLTGHTMADREISVFLPNEGEKLAALWKELSKTWQEEDSPFSGLWGEERKQFIAALEAAVTLPAMVRLVCPNKLIGDSHFMTEVAYDLGL